MCVIDRLGGVLGKVLIAKYIGHYNGSNLWSD